MPVRFGTTVLSVLFDRVTGVLTVTAQALGENRYPASAIHYRKSGSVVPFTLSLTSWSDTQAVGTVTLPILGGWYDVRAVSSSNEYSDWLLNAFKVPAGARFFFFDNGEKR